MVRGGGWAKSRTRWWLDTSVQFARGAHTVRVSRRSSWFPFETVLSSRPSLERDLFSYIRRWICACKTWTTTQRTNTKKTTEVILIQRGVFVYERPVQHRNWREWDRKRKRERRARESAKGLYPVTVQQVNVDTWKNRKRIWYFDGRWKSRVRCVSSIKGERSCVSRFRYVRFIFRHANRFRLSARRVSIIE